MNRRLFIHGMLFIFEVKKKIDEDCDSKGANSLLLTNFVQSKNVDLYVDVRPRKLSVL